MGAVGAVRARLGLFAGAGILAATLWWQGTGALLAGVRGVDGTTLLAALGLGLFTTVLCAWRWCLVARGLGIRLPLGRAVADYYRALFLNAALPGGVIGDVHRGVRHGRSAGAVGRGIRAVVLERVAGQAVLVATGAALLAAYPAAAPAAALGTSGTSGTTGVIAAVGAVCAVCGLGAVAAVRLRRGPDSSRWRRALRTTLAEARLGLLARANWPGVLVSSVAVLAGHLGMFLLAARAAGSTAPAAELLPLMVLALLAMALPLNVGGWGPREGVTAWAFGAAGLGTAQGLTVAVVYGLLALVASLPGLGVLAVQWVAGMRRPQVELEEGVLAEGGTPHRRPERVPHQVGAGEADARDAVADQDRRDGHVQPVKRTRVQEARHGDTAALDQHPAETAPRELVHQAAGGERGAVGQRQYVNALDVLDASGTGTGTGDSGAVGAHHPQGRRLPVREHPAPQRHPAVRVEDDAHRVLPGTGPDRQPGIVGDGGAGPDDHRVGQRAQPVQVLPVLRTGDVVGVTLAGRDEPVEALPQLCERGARTGQAERQIAVGEDSGGGRGVPPPEPAVGTPEQPGGRGVRLGPYAEQPLPGFRGAEHGGTALHRAAAAGHRASPGAGSGDSVGASNEKYPANESVSPASNSLPFSAVAKDGRPITPVSV
ncbi:flippase-like domain-containing protein [Streptomyces sp. FIT100]|nr:flippase-like domain-containing protein [Streptomyces sp. FIT100]